MKVLFAVKDDKVSEAIVKKYQEKYQEIISYKNVYYFNAIYKELQKEKSYDRIVINEDLEPFANNNYDNIDKFLFDKLDNISDEASDSKGNDIPVILVCLDRRVKSDDMLVKYFGIGIYSALIGKDRSLEELCNLIKHPRTKKEAKQYYKIGADSVNYRVENENSVSEAEMQNIIAHYKRLGKNEDKFVDSFNNIISQYNDEQLKIIIQYLPNNVKSVLQQESLKYQQLTNFIPEATKSKKNEYSPLSRQLSLNRGQNEQKLQGKKILIPREMNFANTEKVDIHTAQEEKESPIQEKNEIQEEKRGRGRPKKVKTEEELKKEHQPKRGRGRPKKINTQTENQEVQNDDELDLLTLIDEVENNSKQDEEDMDLFAMDTSEVNIEDEDDIDLFSMDDSEEKNVDEDDIDLFSMDDSKEEPVDDDLDLFALDDSDEVEEKNEEENNTVNDTLYQMQVAQTNAKYNLNRLLTADKKVVSFLGTTKNGTSFIVNNVANVIANLGVSVAILDMTKNRNSYYIYTENNEELRKIAATSLTKLNSGIAQGVKVNKYLTVYSGMPNEDYELDIYQVLATLIEYHSIVLIDCDFDTNVDIFKESQEIYLVQSLDVLTIQPLTAFLRELKMKGALEQNKIKIVINKDQKVKGLSPKVLIGGMSTYNEPSMSFMTELFNKDMVHYVKIPFDVKNYTKYLEGLVECRVTTGGYTKQFMLAIHELANMVYPLISNKKYLPSSQGHFNNQVNSTLEKMKKNNN